MHRRTGLLRYVNAGHDSILLGEQDDGFRPLAPPRGILVGVAETAEYGVASVALRPGDALVLYTDGVTEAMNPEHQCFTLDRLIGCLAMEKRRSARDIADTITQAVQSFADGAP